MGGGDLFGWRSEWIVSDPEGRVNVFHASLANILNKCDKKAVFMKTIELWNVSSRKGWIICKSISKKSIKFTEAMLEL